MDTDSSGSGIIGLLGGLIGLAFLVLMLMSIWKVFTKAGQPGWAAFVPIYNLIVMLNIVGKPIWWILLFMVPLVNIYAFFSVTILLAKSFGKSTGFGLGLLFLGFIFFPLLGFGSARYLGPAGGSPLIASAAGA
jgi:hypothetical protein